MFSLDKNVPLSLKTGILVKLVHSERLRVSQQFSFPHFCLEITGSYFPRCIPHMPQLSFNKTCFQIQIGHSLVQSGQKNWSPAEPPGPQRLSSVWTESSSLLLYRKTAYTCSPQGLSSYQVPVIKNFECLCTVHCICIFSSSAEAAIENSGHDL